METLCIFAAATRLGRIAEIAISTTDAAPVLLAGQSALASRLKHEHDRGAEQIRNVAETFGMATAGRLERSSTGTLRLDGSVFCDRCPFKSRNGAPYKDSVILRHPARALLRRRLLRDFTAEHVISKRQIPSAPSQLEACCHTWPIRHGTPLMQLAAQIVGGLALLFLGGEWLVRGAVSLASRFKVSPLIIGLSVIAAGTSAPELFVSLVSALEGRPGIAIGNVVGSNVANILLVLGASALIWPVVVRRRVVRRDGLALIAATAVFCLLAIGGKIDRHFGIAMLILLFAYLYASYLAELKDARTLSKIEEEVAEMDDDRPVWLISVFLIGGFGGVIMGSNLLVEGAVGVATDAGVSETVIGVTLVALGTSLPELAASIAAARNRHTELALGNVIGSCIFNLLAIVGVVSTTISLDVPEEVVAFDLWVMTGITAAFIAVSFLAPRLGRAVGLGMLLLYGAYIAAQFAGLSAMPAMGQDG